MSSEKIKSDSSEKQINGDNYNESVQQLKELLDADKKFQNIRKDAPFLLRFLHCKNFDIHLAYRMIDDFISFFLKRPEWFVSGSLLEFKEQFEFQSKGFLPNGSDREGRRIYFSLLGSLNPDRTTCMDSIHVDEFWFELFLDDPEFQAKGVAVVVDSKGVSWKLLQWLTPHNLKYGGKTADILPCKEYVYHIVNTSTIVNTFIRMVWPFLPSRMTEKFYFHYDNWSSLHKHIDPSILPEEYGGTAPSLNFDEIRKELYKNADVIEQQLKYLEILSTKD